MAGVKGPAEMMAVPDLSYLTDDERAAIQKVLDKQKEEETRDSEIMR